MDASTRSEIVQGHTVVGPNEQLLESAQNLPVDAQVDAPYQYIVQALTQLPVTHLFECVIGAGFLKVLL